MKRIATIHLKNFKAFRDQLFDFEGKHVLIYGNNGSGKSSLFWALYTFLQSSRKKTPEIQRYFQPFDADNPNTFRSLKNVFADEGDDAFIKLTSIDTETGIRTEQCIAKEDIRINTNVRGSVIREADLASDFINYKLLQNFYNVSHRQETNLWPVFERDVFPFFDKNDRSYKEIFDELYEDVPRQADGARAATGSRIKDAYIGRIEDFNSEIDSFLLQIQQNANAVLKDHFFEGKDVLKIYLEYKEQLDYETVNKRHIDRMQIRLSVSIARNDGGEPIRNYRPHSFLNEAQLTRIAIAIRIGALQTRTLDPDFKVLCLDDMLISLDMSNRDKVIKIILNYDGKGFDYFSEFQKIILTHDKGFYNIIRRYTYPQDWKYYELRRDEKDNSSPPVVTPGLTLLQTATKRFEESQFEECALSLRKEIEELCKWELDNFDEEKEFRSLKTMLSEMKNKLCEQERTRFNALFVRNTLPLDVLKKLDADIDSDETLTEQNRYQLKGIKKKLSRYLIQQYEDTANVTHLLDKVQFVVDFYLNKNAHPTTSPNYEEEVREALDVVKQLNNYISKRKGLIA